MRKKSLQQVEEILERQRLQLEETMERLVTETSPRTPQSLTTAGLPTSQAFDALRQSVDAATKATRTHQAHLAEIHSALVRSGGSKVALLLVNDFMREVGLRLERDISRRDLFTDQEGTGPEGSLHQYEVVAPAYLDELTGRVIRQGVIARVAGASA